MMLLPSFLLLIAGSQAAPSSLTARQSITTLSTAQIAPFKPYAYFASAAYCKPKATSAWSCGEPCDGNQGFETVASGGDGAGVQYWFVGYNPSSEEVIVAHQGTNTTKLRADFTDTDFFLRPLDFTLFPGMPKGTFVHNGFADEQAKTAGSILSAVMQAMTTYSATKVTMVGHSLGAAISLLDSVYLPLHLPDSTTFKTVCYGLPRVGNQYFANYVDANLDLTHINNKKDPVPIILGMFLGFVHPAGEVHIQASGAWDSCTGQDNPSNLCIVGDVPYIFDSDEADHDGPYDGVEMGGC